MILRNLADSQEKEVEYYVSLGMDLETAQTIVYGAPQQEKQSNNEVKKQKKDGK